MRFSRRDPRMFDRRKFLRVAGGAVGGAVALGSGGAFVRARRAEAQVSLRPFVDALPIPRVITPDGRLDAGPFFEQRTYHYPNDQAATQLWYHDHALGATRLNNFAGLQGVYLLRDRVEDSLNLPDGDFEIPLTIQDRFFTANGSLLYPVEDNGGDPDPRVPPVWIPEFFGDTLLVNGKVWPVLEVEPRKYRFRILN